MAAWQFDISFVPRSWLLARFGAVPPRLEPDELADADWSAELTLPPDYAQELSEFLPAGRSWSKDILLWGDEPGDRVEVYLNEDRRPDGVSTRIDVRERTPAVVQGMARFAQRCDRVLLYVEKDALLMEPTEENLIRAIRRSNAYQFVGDPIGYLHQLSQNRSTDQVADQ